MNGTAAYTEIVAGAVLWVREVDWWTVRVRTGDGVRTLTAHLHHQQQADDQVSVSVGRSQVLPHGQQERHNLQAGEQSRHSAFY